MKAITKSLFAPVLGALKKQDYFPMFVAGLCLAFISCSKDKDEERYTFEELEEYNYKHIPVKSIDKGNYLFEVYNDDYWTKYYYNPLTMSNELNGVKQYHGVCAGIRNGNFFGRNLDWSCGVSPEFVVHTPAKDGRHATVGICTTNLVKEMPKEQTWLSQMLVNDLTLNCFDGINDAGVCMVLLVVHYNDGGGEPTGTNPKAEKTIHGSNLLRYVLDYANSAAHGIELMKSVNTYGKLEHYTFHWMLCDEKETYFVELMNNSVVATKAEENPIEKFRKPIITNFYLQKDTVGTNQLIPGGVERYDILSKDYDKATTVNDMFDVLKNVRFSRKYEGKNPSKLNPGETDNNWYSEFYSYVLDPDTFKPLFFDKYSDRQKMWDDMISKDIRDNAIWLFDNPRLHQMTSWTCHTSVYNIKERKMQIVIGEDYDAVLPTPNTYFELK